MAILRQRCGGSAGASAASFVRLLSAVSTPVRNWSAGCCDSLASAFRATRRRERVLRVPTAIWAEENTREAIFNAMQRKETFAVSGPQIKARFFGGWNLTEGLEGEALTELWQHLPAAA